MSQREITEIFEKYPYTWFTIINLMYLTGVSRTSLNHNLMLMGKFDKVDKKWYQFKDKNGHKKNVMLYRGKL